jgi:hypothetical protein
VVITSFPVIKIGRKKRKESNYLKIFTKKEEHYTLYSHMGDVDEMCKTKRRNLHYLRLK